MNGNALDIGGSRARITRFEGSQVIDHREIWLPDRRSEEADFDWGLRRVDAIAELVGSWKKQGGTDRLPTACAGRKDDARESVVLSTYASPLPGLVPTVRERTGVDLGPLFDDDVCAGWGHLESPRGGLERHGEDAVLLTAGTGLAESLWVNGAFLLKGTYPRLAELGLEEPLRTEAWRGGELPLSALRQVVEARSTLARFRRVVLSGRFAGPGLSWPDRLEQDVELRVCPLEEAPALGALVMARLGLAR